ncbi:MAG: 2-C-methyl-D-erythritol 4-phosphate cytidylyltransferase [Lachnospiraceae bacterium]|nr:2-C-methyl-D-erythritol 4-phosphate cytidylyltransferase [Lachnospiraceae bacterium]
MENSNVFGVVLAGGKGTRMGNVEKPKQFMEIGGKPILIHTIEKFVLNTEFEQVLVLSPKQWIKHTEDLIRRYIPTRDRIVVIEGGTTRNETIMNSIAYIEQQGRLNEDTVIVTHDSVRPFLTYRILEENIRYAREYGACDTVIAATDTIVESRDRASITDIPDRSTMYQGQTPQSFKAMHLRTLYQSLTEEEKQILTDACKILVIKGEQVHLVEGEVSNIKITYPYDLRVAEALLGGK